MRPQKKQGELLLIHPLNESQGIFRQAEKVYLETVVKRGVCTLYSKEPGEDVRLVRGRKVNRANNGGGEKTGIFYFRRAFAYLLAKQKGVVTQSIVCLSKNQKTNSL